MPLLGRNRQVTNVLALAGAVLVFAGVLLGSYFDERQDLLDERSAKLRALEDGHFILQREAQLKQFQAGAGASMKSDAATVESQLLHLVHDWEEQTSVSHPSFGRVAAVEQHGFTCLTFQISASGPMGSAAGLLYRVETSPMPLRLDSASVRPKEEAGDEVEIHLTVSALCKAEASKIPAPPVADEAQTAEGATP